MRCKNINKTLTIIQYVNLFLQLIISRANICAENFINHELQHFDALPLLLPLLLLHCRTCCLCIRRVPHAPQAAPPPLSSSITKLTQFLRSLCSKLFSRQFSFVRASVFFSQFSLKKKKFFGKNL